MSKREEDDLTLDEILQQSKHILSNEEPSDELPEITADDLRDYQGRYNI